MGNENSCCTGFQPSHATRSIFCCQNFLLALCVLMSGACRAGIPAFPFPRRVIDSTSSPRFSLMFPVWSLFRPPPCAPRSAHAGRSNTERMLMAAAATPTKACCDGGKPARKCAMGTCNSANVSLPCQCKYAPSVSAAAIGLHGLHAGHTLTRASHFGSVIHAIKKLLARATPTFSVTASAAPIP
jgi:hypothetical protein